MTTPVQSSAYTDILALHNKKNIGEEVKFYKDQIALKQDTFADKILLVTSGQFNVSFRNKHNRKEFNADIGCKGDILGAAPIISQLPFYDFNVVAAKLSTGVFIDYHTLSGIINEREHLKSSIAQLVFQNMQRSLRRSAINATMTAKDRIVSLLTDEYKRLSFEEKNGETVKLKMSRTTLSEKIGISREVTSKMMKELNQEGFIGADGYSILIYPSILDYQVDYEKYKPSHKTLESIEIAINNLITKAAIEKMDGLKITQRELAAKIDFPLHQVRRVVSDMVRSGKIHCERGIYYSSKKTLSQ